METQYHATHVFLLADGFEWCPDGYHSDGKTVTPQYATPEQVSAAFADFIQHMNSIAYYPTAEAYYAENPSPDTPI